MILVKIGKNGQTYDVHFTAGETLEQAYEKAKEIAQGRETLESPINILDLGTSRDYEYIHATVVEQEPEVEVEPPKEAVLVENEDGVMLEAFYDKITYLGNTVEVSAVKARMQGVPFILVHEVNGLPALMTMSRTNLEQLANHVGLVQGMAHPAVVLQPGDLSSDEEAIEYLSDYLEDLRKEADHLPKSEMTAVAFPEINEKEREHDISE